MKKKYIKDMIDVLLWLIIFMVGQFLISYLFSFCYTLVNSNLPLDVLTNKTSLFLEKNKVIITLIGFILFIIIFIRQYKKLRRDNYKFNKEYLFIFLFGIGYSIIINILFLNISNITGINYDQFSTVSASDIIPLILCSGIMGPILEEYLFRGILFNKLNKFNDKKGSMFLTSLIFSLVHANLFNMINTFILSYILIYLYEKYKTLLAPIILHVSVNTTVVLIINIIVSNFNNLNYILFFMGFVFILISSVKIFKNT